MPQETLKEKIRADLNEARKAREKLRTTVLTTMLSEIRNREIEMGREAGDEDVQGLVTRAIKRRREAAGLMRGGGRQELAAKEEEEAELLKAYLPEQLGEDEVRALVREAVAAGAGDMGGVMKQVSPKAKGKFDGRELSRIVKEELAG